MAGIYIHIPFCKQACYYCNFHFTVNQKHKDDFTEALLKEIVLRKDYLQGEPIETIYFGGGTPSVLSIDAIKRILDTLHRHFEIVPGAEVTLEANPDDLDKRKIAELKTTSVNRFSMGVQSFHDDDLKYLHRAHNAQQADYAIKLAQDAGFENITIDLIYAIPHLTDVKWKSNLEKLKQLNIPHFSSYCLTVEPKTPLEKFIQDKKMPDVDDVQAAHQFEMLMDFAETSGYEHYEISNFAKAEKYSRHNTSYWTGKKYLGLGPSAHSFDGISRQWNVANTSLYMQSLEKGALNFEKEELSERDRFNEYVMTSLRTKWGIDIIHLQEKFGLESFQRLEENGARYFDNGSVLVTDNKLTLTRAGKLIADKIISDLFDTE